MPGWMDGEDYFFIESSSSSSSSSSSAWFIRCIISAASDDGVGVLVGVIVIPFRFEFIIRLDPNDV